MMRLSFAIAMVILVMYTPVWVFVPCAFLFAVYFDGYELIALGAFVDALYGTTGALPYTLLLLTLAVLCGLWLQPRFLLYTR